MKVNINFIYSFLLIIIIFFTAIEFHNNNVLESRINSLNKNDIDFNSDKTFKEDYYITQQSHDTNLILVVFTVLIAFTGLFTYVNIIERYNSKMSEVKDEIKKYKSDWDKNHNLVLELKARIDLDTSRNNNIQSTYFFYEKDYEYYITSFLDSVKYKVYHHLWMSDKFPDIKDILTNEIISELKRFLKTFDKIEIPKTLSNFELTTLDKEIRKINNDEVNNLLSIIYSKLTPVKTD